MTRELAGCFPLWEGGADKVFDQAPQRLLQTVPTTVWLGDPLEVGTLVNSPIWADGYRHGPGIRFADDDSHVQLGGDNDFDSNLPQSFLFRFKPYSVTGIQVISFIGASGQSYLTNQMNHCMYLNGDDLELRFGRGGSNQVAIDTGNFVSIDEWYTVAWSCKSGRQQMVLNGIEFTGTVTSPLYPYGDKRWVLGCDTWNAPLREFVGVIDLAMCWGIEMSMGALHSIVRDPFQMFMPDRRVLSERYRQYCYRRALR
jgi:hypothetical protein